MQTVIKTLFLASIFAFLVGCGSASLPKKTADNSNFGVIAFLQEVENVGSAPKHLTTFAFEPELTGPNYEQIHRINPQNGKSMQFIQGLEPGEYTFARYKFVRINRTSSRGTGGSNRLYDYRAGSEFLTVKAGEVSVLPLKFKLKKTPSPSGGWRTQPTIEFVYKDEMQDYKNIFSNLDNANEWQVNWNE